ncbi:MAG: hypothetical protein ACSHYB_11870 [Roseibacillus sp.]
MNALNLAVVGLLALALSMEAQVIWDESSDGDLSNAYLSPNVFALSFGTQSVLGTVSAGSNLDRDLFTIQIPAGGELTAFSLVNYDSSDPDNITFVGMQEGATLSRAPSNNFSDAIGYALFGFDDIGKDLLPTITGNPFIPPFFGENPLPAGEYAIWVNETATTADYEFEFEVVEVGAVPEPSISLLGVVGASLLFGRRKRN